MRQSRQAELILAIKKLTDEFYPMEHVDVRFYEAEPDRMNPLANKRYKIEILVTETEFDLSR